MSILLVITIIVTYVLGSNIQKIISKPILRLAKLTKEISQTGDYSRTIHVKSRDEIGILYTEFDNLLKVITQKNNEREQNKQVIIKLNEELEEKVKHRTRELLIEKEKTQELLNVSDNLLLNILPETIADRLKNGETTIADHYENASVVFIDIVDFTRKSANADPKRIVEVLNGLYSKLDSIAMKHGLEKIKTIGDCYMAAAGVPVINKNNACMAVKFAIEAMNTICDYDTGDGTIINFRCGIDGGPVVAGIIGERKFIYDLWGDTVNTASRMEEYGEAGKIHITERFANSLINSEEKLKITFEERGEIEIRGKGKMKTYFLNDYK
jgi:class 3 adenylate cyclase